MNQVKATVPEMPAAKAQRTKTLPAVPQAFRRKPTLIFKMPIEEQEEKFPGRYSLICPKG